MKKNQKAETKGKLVVGYTSTDNRISPAETGSTRKSIGVINSEICIAQNRNVFRV
jgi:hypothetical protein